MQLILKSQETTNAKLIMVSFLGYSFTLLYISRPFASVSQFFDLPLQIPIRFFSLMRVIKVPSDLSGDKHLKDIYTKLASKSSAKSNRQNSLIILL